MNGGKLAAVTTQKITASGRLPEVCEGLRPLLTTHGFTLSRRVFRRVAETGLVQVISLGAGQNWSMYHGKFTVDVGIYIDEVFRGVYHWRDPPRIVMPGDCEITRRLPAFQPGVEDYWWELDWPVPTVCRQIGNLLTLYGIPF